MWTNRLCLRIVFMLGIALQYVHADPLENSSTTTTATPTELLKSTMSLPTTKMNTVPTTEKKTASFTALQTTSNNPQPQDTTVSSTKPYTIEKSIVPTTTSMKLSTLSPLTSQSTTAAQTVALTKHILKSSESAPEVKQSMQSTVKTASTEAANPTQPTASQSSAPVTTVSKQDSDLHSGAATIIQSHSESVPTITAKSEATSFTATSSKTGQALSTTTVSETAQASATVTATHTATALPTATKTALTTASSTTSSNKPTLEVEIIINGNPSYNSPELPKLNKVCSELLKKIQRVPTGKCNMNVREDANELNFISIELAADPAIADKIYNDIKKQEDKNMSVDDEIPKTMIAILSSVGGLVLILLLIAIYCSCHRQSYRKNQQHLTEELQTVENGYHDNPTLEVMEVQSEMQEKKLALNGEFNDSWIVPFDNLTKEEIPDEEDTHL